jgi:hypothetical protein
MAGGILRMPTWSDVLAHIRGRYRLQTETPQHFVLAWQIEDARPEAAPFAPAQVQGVFGQCLTVGDKSFLVLRAEVASERSVSPQAALRHSARLILGALVLSGNQYFLRYSLPLQSLDLEELDYALQYVAREAAAARQRLVQNISRSRGPMDTD